MAPLRLLRFTRGGPPLPHYLWVRPSGSPVPVCVPSDRLQPFVSLSGTLNWGMGIKFSVSFSWHTLRENRQIGGGHVLQMDNVKEAPTFWTTQKHTHKLYTSMKCSSTAWMDFRGIRHYNGVIVISLQHISSDYQVKYPSSPIITALITFMISTGTSHTTLLQTAKEKK